MNDDNENIPGRHRFGRSLSEDESGEMMPLSDLDRKSVLVVLLVLIAFWCVVGFAMWRWLS